MQRSHISAFILVAIVCSLRVSVAWGANYYIDPVGGNDANSGLSPDKPKQHVPTYALATGSDILLKRGTTCSDQISIRQKGTPEDPVIIGAYGTGPNPVVNLGNHGQILGVATSTYPYIIVQDINFISSEKEISQCAISVYHPRNITIRRCTFEGVNGSGIIFVYGTPSGTAIGDIHVENCAFMNSPSATAVKGYTTADDSDPGSLHDLTISQSTFNHVRAALSFFGSEEFVGSNDYAPYGIIFEDNLVTNTTEAAIGTYTGIKKVANHTSYIRRNAFTNIGAITIPNINGLQIQWARDLIIEDNRITNVYTSLCDGAGIVIDFAWAGGSSDESYLCDGVVVRRNIITGCKSCSDCSGIGIPNGTNTKVYNNFCFDNGSGARVSRTHATGNVFYNNTFVNNVTYGLYLTEAPVVTIRNNIFSFNPIGLAVRFNSATPIEDHNCFYGNTTYDIRNTTSSTTPPPDPTDITSDPKLSSVSTANGYAIAEDSLCRNAGIFLSDVTTDLTGYARPIGSYNDIGCYAWRIKGKPTGVKVKLR